MIRVNAPGVGAGWGGAEAGAEGKNQQGAAQVGHGESPIMCVGAVTK